MKTITKYDHCFGGVWAVDGKHYDTDEGEHPDKDEELIDYLLEKLKEELKNGHTSFDDIINCFQYSDYEAGSSCETCGHYDGKTTWEI